MAVAAFAPIALSGTSVEYRPTTGVDSGRFVDMEGMSPEALVVEMLWRSGRLPEPGAQLVHASDGSVVWEPEPDLSAPAIDAVTVERVRVTASQPLFWRLLDDDPTYGAQVDVIVSSSDGLVTTLRVEVWDYGLLTPWSLHLLGDGWKPSRIEWGLDF